jgi:hypothetical protein
LRPQLYVAGSKLSPGGVTDFLKKHLGDKASNINLEVISPFFDGDSKAEPLLEIIQQFQPKETRVFLPRDTDRAAKVPIELYQEICNMPGVQWGKLPADLLQRGTGKNVVSRNVHAKIYRFFRSKPRYEALLVGSVNLTRAAHQGSANMESAILIERDLSSAPDWWLAKDGSRPEAFEIEAPSEEGDKSNLQALIVRYNWETATGDVLWNTTKPSPAMRIDAQGSHLFSLNSLAPKEWKTLGVDDSKKLNEILRNNTFLTVNAENERPAIILVLEEGMSHKPSLFFKLSLADILKLWAFLSPAQKAALLAYHMGDPGFPVSPGQRALIDSNGIFQTYAGIFQAFAGAERSLMTALEKKRHKDADYHLFGKKYDSLPCVLDRITEEQDLEPVKRYLVLLCIRQLLIQVETQFPAYAAAQAKRLGELQKRLLSIQSARGELDLGPDGDSFIKWYEKWFVDRAEVKA